MYEYNLGIRFQNVAEDRAGHAAIWFNEREIITYAELNKLANRIAHWLRAVDVRRGDVVCLSGEKTRHTFACILASLKIGAVYCVIDPDSPVERLRKVLGTCRPKLLLTGRELLTRLSEHAPGLELQVAEKDSDEFESAIAAHNEKNPTESREVTGTNAAYLMFTSGSTGYPKGAVMTHANVLNLIDWSRETFGITVDDRLTNVNALFFDNSVFDFYSALLNGACLVAFSKIETTNPGLLVQKLDTALCTLWFSVPSLLIFLQTMKATDGRHLGSIRRFIFGGEGYPKAKLKALFDAYSNRSRFFNVYGPTECTCICSCYEVTAEDFADLNGLPPLGYMAANFGYLILDEAGREVPPGENGELCLLGPNVGRGYYNDAARTAASFVPNPGNNSFHEVMYKTGDLVRFEPADGKLYIQGRMDNQVKHMGYRIELEEIEAALHCLEYVSEAAVLHSNMNGLSRIIAIVAGKELAADRIRLDLKQIIPDYMIPSVFHREEVLPKNPNGKVDRRHLAQKYLLSAQEDVSA